MSERGTFLLVDPKTAVMKGAITEYINARIDDKKAEKKLKANLLNDPNISREVLVDFVFSQIREAKHRLFLSTLTEDM